MDNKPVELTKKQQLNDHITGTRKFVRQAKVHVIRKLVREIKLLRDRKGSEKAQVKSNRKADRLYAEISVIKALDEDKVTIHALLNKLTLQDLLKNTNSSLEDKALARLSHHPSVNARVTKYREANVNWRLQIPVLLEKNPAKSKLAEKKAKQAKVDGKEKIEEHKVDEEQIEEHEVDDDEQSEVSEVEDDEQIEESEVEDDEQIEESEVEDDEQSEESEVEDDEQIEESEVDEEKIEELKVDEKIKGRKVGSDEKAKRQKVDGDEKKQVQQKRSVILDLNKTQGTIKVQVIKDWSEFEVEDSKEKPEFNAITSLPKQKPKSSFFLGGKDEPPAYLTSKQGEASQGNKLLNRGSFKSKPSRGADRHLNSEYSNSKSFQSHRGEKLLNPSYLKSKSSSHSARQLESYDAPKTFTRNTSSKVTQVEPPTSQKEHLHPSWEAKKRQNLSLDVFKGKKIKFD